MKIDLDNLTQEIFGIDVKPNRTYKQIRNDFFKILRKYKIKQSDKNGCIDSYPWSACEAILHYHIQTEYSVGHCIEKVPKDLQ